MTIQPDLHAEPLPAALCGLDGGFTEHTLRERMPALTERVISDNSFSAEINARLRTLRDEILHGQIRHFEGQGADSAEWRDQIAPYVGKSWLEVPWLFAEIYHFRRILEATDYFSNGIDPFALQKRQALEAAAADVESIVMRLEGWLSDDNPQDALATLLSLSMWGNQADLGLFPIGTEQPTQASDESRAATTLVDDSQAVCNYLLQGKQERVDFLLDNSGLEFCSDLCLADYLLSNDLVTTIVMHCKDHPYFVSDVMRTDVAHTLDFFDKRQSTVTRNWVNRLRIHLRSGKLKLQDDPVWTVSGAYRQWQTRMNTVFAHSAVVISKGDLNYRRWLGDLHWSYSAALAPIVAFRSTPLLLLRTLKSEVVVGLSQGQVEQLSRQEPDWLVTGRYGVIQFCPPLGKL